MLTSRMFALLASCCATEHDSSNSSRPLGSCLKCISSAILDFKLRTGTKSYICTQEIAWIMMFSAQANNLCLWIHLKVSANNKSSWHVITSRANISSHSTLEKRARERHSVFKSYFTRHQSYLSKVTSYCLMLPNSSWIGPQANKHKLLISGVNLRGKFAYYSPM